MFVRTYIAQNKVTNLYETTFLALHPVWDESILRLLILCKLLKEILKSYRMNLIYLSDLFLKLVFPLLITFKLNDFFKRLPHYVNIQTTSTKYPEPCVFFGPLAVILDTFFCQKLYVGTFFLGQHVLILGALQKLLTKKTTITYNR